MTDSCKARQHGDEYQCGQCGLTWDVRDPEPPKCADIGRKLAEQTLADLRAMFGSEEGRMK